MNHNGLRRLMSGIKGCRAAILIAAALLLAACDDSNNKGVVTPPAAQASTSAAKTPASKPTDTVVLAELAKRHAGQPLTLLDASELQLDGASAMVLTFS